MAVSAVTFWEIAILAERNRLVLGCTPAHRRSDRIADGLRELPVYGTEAVRAVALETRGLPQRPADRSIVATALLDGDTLLTTDREILAWPGELTASTSANNRSSVSGAL